jgi:predicted transcriptional regulator
MSRGVRSVDDDELLAVFRESPDPALFVKEVAAEVEYTRQGVKNRLDTLVDDGELVKKKGGKRSAVYWLASAESSAKARSPS